MQLIKTKTDDDNHLVTFESKGKLITVSIPREDCPLYGSLWGMDEPFGLNTVTAGHYS